MSNAISNPVIRRPGAELHTADIRQDQKPDVTSREELEEEVIVSPGGVEKDYQAALAMAEEPVTIRIEKSAEKNPAPMIDCWVNGRGAEVLINNKWVPLGYLPVGVVVTTKRKYVEVLARSKIETINTKHEDATVPDPKNVIERYTSSRAPFSVIEDRNPKGAEWLTRLVRSL